MHIDTGNAYELDTRGTGWFVGFSEWTRPSTAGLRHIARDEPLAGLCMKWFDHPPGMRGDAKPVSEGRTLSILVNDGGEFEIDFCESADFSGELRTVRLARPGDFVAWGAGLYHRWRCARRATIATLRWGPAPPAAH
jgi:hypothetical protein